MKRDRLIHSILCGAGILLIGLAAAGADDTALPAATPSIIVSGSNNVSVGGQDAARKGDTTDAAEAVAEGSSNVFINGKPAVRRGRQDELRRHCRRGRRKRLRQWQADGSQRRPDVRLPRQVAPAPMHVATAFVPCAGPLVSRRAVFRSRRMNWVCRVLFAVALLLASSAALAPAARAVELSEKLQALQKKATALYQSGAYREALQASEETLAADHRRVRSRPRTDEHPGLWRGLRRRGRWRPRRGRAPLLPVDPHPRRDLRKRQRRRSHRA